MKRRRRSPFAGAVAGAMAGLAAAWAMNTFQAALSSDTSDNDEKEDPTTVKFAELIHGRPLRDDQKKRADTQVHYGFGLVTGAVYGALATAQPAITIGLGLPYGTALALLADEGIVPALGIAPPPWQTPAKTHAYSLASHLVFGAVLETVRRLVWRAV